MTARLLAIVGFRTSSTNKLVNANFVVERRRFFLAMRRRPAKGSDYKRPKGVTAAAGHQQPYLFTGYNQKKERL